MTYKQGIPEHAVESTYKFFDRVYVGKCGGKHEEDENGYKMSWDSRHEDLKPSATHGKHYCVYCGEHPMPIQPYDMGYEVTGYMCLCEKAQVEVAINEAILQAEEKHRLEIQSLKRQIPQPSEAVKRKIIQARMKDGHYLDRMLESLGF